MPGGVPVASMAIGTAGAVNAGYLAVQILALSDATLAQKLLQDREANEQLIRDKDAAALQKLSN